MKAFNLLHNAENRVRVLIPASKKVFNIKKRGQIVFSLVCIFFFDKWLKLQYKYPCVGKELTRVLRK